MLSLAPAQLCKATIFLALCAASWAVEPFVYMYPLPSYYHSGEDWHFEDAKFALPSPDLITSWHRHEQILEELRGHDLRR